MRAWNPWSDELYKTPDADADQKEWKLYEAIRSQLNFRGRQTFYYDGFSSKSWAKRYPKGIPPRSSAKYRNYVASHRNLKMRCAVLTPRGIINEADEHEIPASSGGWDVLDD